MAGGSQPARSGPKLSKAIFFALRMGKGMTYEQWRIMKRWEIAEEMGWSLEYIDSLSPEDLWEWQSVKDGRSKARQSVQQKANMESARSAGKGKGRRR